MKKIILMILSLAMVISSMTAIPVLAEEAAVPADGYVFNDIARSDAGTYVAMAKNAALTSARLYYSNDGGLTWSPSSNQPLGSAVIYSNKASQQQLVWWADKGIFVAHGDKSTYTSADGITWTENTNIHWTANTMLTASGDQLIFGGDKSANATSNLEAKQFANNKYTISDTTYYAMSVAAKPADADGNIAIFINGANRCFDLNLNVSESGTYNWSTVNSNSGNTTMSPYDMIYASNADQFLSVDASDSLLVAKNSQYVSKYVIKPGVNVTGIGANDTYIVAGMSDGTMYYTQNTTDGITADTVWNEISAEPNTTVCTEPVKNIEFSYDGSFIALSETQIYIADTETYCNVKEYVKDGKVEIGTPTVAGQNLFKGVRLIGGAYSPVLDKYIVYGDTTSVDAGGKYWGKIFVSDNGTEWDDVYTGYTFSLRNFNDDGTLRSYTEVRNGAVWWNDKFIVSASTKDHTGISLVSTDGINWKAIQPIGNTDADGNALPELDTDFRLNTDIAIAGDNLYTTNNGRQFRKYTAWNKDSMSYVGITNVPNTWYMNQIAVSDEEDPAVLMAQNGNGAVRNNESTATEELDKWTQINTLGGAGAMTDAVYSKNLGKFVCVLSTGYRTSIVSKDGVVEQGAVVPGGKVCSTIDTNGEVFMFACEDGNVYSAPDTADFKLGTALTKVSAAPIVLSENVMKVTNVFKANDRFIATSSDNTDSDVMIIAKNTSGTYEYIKASENVKVEELIPGESLNIEVNGINESGKDYTFDLITAIYSNGALVQIQSDTKTLSKESTQKLTTSITLNNDLPSDAVMKIFMWNSVGQMVPVGDVTTPF